MNFQNWKYLAIVLLSWMVSFCGKCSLFWGESFRWFIYSKEGCFKWCSRSTAILIHLHLDTESLWTWRFCLSGRGGHSVCESESRSILGWCEMDINNFQLLLSRHLHEGDGLFVMGIKDKTYLWHWLKMVWKISWRTIAIYMGTTSMGSYSEREKWGPTSNTAWASRNL